MKKIILTFIAIVSAVTSFAKTISDGYYRIQNVGYSRYMSILDRTGWARASSGGVDYDLYAIRTLLDNDANHITSNPATIIHVTPLNSSDYTFSAQGVDAKNHLLSSTDDAHININRTSANAQTYTLTAHASGITTVTLSDVSSPSLTKVSGDSGIIMTSGSKGRYWRFTPVESSSSNYFGFSPSLEVNGKYYQTFYADFPFRIVSSGVNVYYISNLKRDSAVYRQFSSGDVVPGATPVLVECSSNSASDNKVQPVTETGTAVSYNYLRGVYFNYYLSRGSKSHDNRTAFDPSTMRVLRVQADGTLAFVNNPSEAANGTYYLPANEAYLSVPAGTAAVVPLMSYADYLTGIKQVTVSADAQDDAVYTLGGTRVTNTNNLPHGVYIKGGKKVMK